MIDLAATLLEVVDHTTRRTGRVSLAIDRIADGILPQTTARAGSCPGFTCGGTCGDVGSCGKHRPNRARRYAYYDQSPTCSSILGKCYTGCTCRVTIYQY